MAYQSRRSFVLSQIYSQAMILVLAVLNTYYPGYLSYTFFAFIALSFVMSFFILRTQMRGTGFADLKEVKSSKKILDGDSTDVMRAMTSDAQLSQDLRPMTRAAVLSLVSMVAVIAWYYLYFNLASGITRDPLVSGEMKFLVFLAGYEVPYGFMMMVSINQRKASKATIQMPRDYAVFAGGIVGQGIVIKFPLREFDVKSSVKRKFVELTKKDRNNPGRIRLYGSQSEELLEAILKYGSGQEATNGTAEQGEPSA